MPSQRKEGKRLVGFFADEEEARALLDAATAEGVSVAEWLRRRVHEADRAATQKPTKPHPPKKK
jgi:hypothetical protein